MNLEAEQAIMVGDDIGKLYFITIIIIIDVYYIIYYLLNDGA